MGVTLLLLKHCAVCFLDINFVAYSGINEDVESLNGVPGILQYDPVREEVSKSLSQLSYPMFMLFFF